MKINLFKFVCFILLITILAMTIVAGTFAKYTSNSSGNSSISVAKWSVKVNGDEIGVSEEKTIDFDLFKTVYNQEGEELTDLEEGMISPGTQGSFDLEIENASEVSAEYQIKFEVENEHAIPIFFSLDEGETWEAELKSTVPKKLEIGAPVDIITIQWKWPFEAEDVDVGDVKDTTLGDLAKTPDKAPQIIVSATIDAVQAGLEKIGEDGDFKYIMLNNEEIQLTRYTGDATELVIPAEYDGYKVKSVGNPNAGTLTAQRYNIIGMHDTTENTTITSVTISEGIEEIDTAAFQGCKALTTVSYPTSLKRIGSYAFTYCTELTGPLNLPENVEYIGLSAYERCGKITGNLVIPSKVTEINNYAFNRCTSLTGLTLHDNITRIGRTAFQYCGFKGTLDLPEELVEIDSYAFNQCKGFTGDLVIPNKVKVIGDWTFQQCQGLNGILTLSNSLEKIGDGFMNHCSKMQNKSLTFPKTLKQIGSLEDDSTHTLYNFAINAVEEYFVEEGNQYFKAIDGVLYDIDVERLIAYPALRRQPFYEIPEGITKIDELAFSRAGSKWHQTDRVNTLEKIKLPNSLILTTTLPSNYLNQGSNLAVGLYKYTGVKEIVLNENNSNYKIIDGMLYSMDEKTLWYVPINRETEVNIPEGTLRIQDGALYTPWDRPSTQLITIPSTVVEIPEYELSEMNIFVSRKMITIHEDCIYQIVNGKITKNKI